MFKPRERLNEASIEIRLPSDASSEQTLGINRFTMFAPALSPHLQTLDTSSLTIAKFHKDWPAK